AVYAIYQSFSDTPRVWWWKTGGGRAHYASGTFIGSNHFAAYMEMIIPLCFGFFMAQKKQTTRLLSGLGGTRAAIQHAVSWFSPESIRPRMFLFFFFAILMGVSLLFSASRGGILSLGASMLLISFLFFSKHRYRKYGGLALGLCLIITVYGLRLGIEPTIEKFKKTVELSNRFHVTRSIVPMIGDYPALGVGWGNFRYLYPRYIIDYDRVSSSGYAHNDWVEAGTEVGLAGSLLILAVFCGYMLSMIRTWRQRRDIYAVGIGAGVMAGILSVAAHSYFDFNMHITANPLTLAALAGIGYAAVHRQKYGYIESFFYRLRNIHLNRFRRIGMACGVLFIFSLFFSAAGRHFIAESHCPVEWNSTMNLNWDPKPADIQKAIARNPGNAEYHFKLFGYLNRVNKNSTLSATAFQQAKNERLIKNLERAVRLNPARGIYWYELGQRYSFRSYDPYGYLNRWLPLAEACYDRGITCAPKDPDMLFNVAWYWVWRSSLLSQEMSLTSSQEVSQPGFKSVLYKRDGIRKFQQLFQRSLSMNPKKWEKAVNRIWEYYPDDSVVVGIVPPSNEALKHRVMMFLAEK
ncbi:O-antigen ligase family protein, partial [Thermodesulfobacteriota bacterium]